MSGPDPLAQDLANRCGLALLYHGTFSSPPELLGDALHNISPQDLFRQLETLSRSFHFVSVDEYCAAGDLRGLATITADDGYQCVVDEAFSVFEALQIPLAIFVNRSFMEGKPFWRDKVRSIMQRRRVGEFEARFAEQFQRDPEQPFYRYTKDPRNNSIRVDEMLDAFLEDEPLIDACRQYYMQVSQSLKAHPLISYGSHSVHHYVLSSLSDDEQWREIDENRRFLETFPGVNRTAVFSIPFGGDRDYNDATIRLAADAGHSAMLLSRGVVQRKDRIHDSLLPMVDRVMPRHAEPPAFLEDLQARLSRG
ncbi:MAG: hypothetical protein CL389_11375 [Acidiferrobacteraceae bacterium]|jgi:peptidoglycan/xylan/chitin deacetylase (PgdA/CDA1 family)|nr:hypothetical protein [Acidiferrobacteraceae bacterium]MDP6398920.1 polysaccharide deacetylase family protein [Arenicellales bacterium]MDP6791885.1 polysaccharide deacetylase family protein [Arenicellales bacterium]MDP6947741.1 polysaccharide deacetylase family protein [Arenicellales bacterium]|tara:strand:- start:27298 stop:28224 length:927 start_codon:yes stop_codon:yes gene_type:complete